MNAIISCPSTFSFLLPVTGQIRLDPHEIILRRKGTSFRLYYLIQLNFISSDLHCVALQIGLGMVQNCHQKKLFIHVQF